MSKEGFLERNEPGVGWVKRLFKLRDNALTTFDEAGTKELESFPLSRDLFPQVFSRPEKNGKQFIFGIITKKDGKTKVLEANAESEESRISWVADIKAVYKDEVSPDKTASGKSNEAAPSDMNTASSTEKDEKDCQCVIF